MGADDCMQPRDATAAAEADGASTPSLARIGLLLLASLLPLCFLLAALTRRLNFDESLGLRAGWLLVEGIPAEPDFYMPTTLALGALGHAISDPGAVFAIARLFAASTVLLAGIWALRRVVPHSELAIPTAALCLVQVGFAVHAYEFRYGWAILVGWLIGFGLLQRRTRHGFALAGFTVGWLAAHHLKGVFFGVALYGICLAVIALEGDRAVRVRRLHVGLLSFALAWGGLSLLLGLGDELPGLYRTFAGVAAEEARIWPWAALGPDLRGDPLWWLGAVAALGAFAIRAARRLRGGSAGGDLLRAALDSPRAWALVFAALPIAFLFVHPHPWPYMLALPAPFLALLMVLFGRDLVTGLEPGARSAAAAALVLVIVIHGGWSARWPGAAYAAALAAPNSEQVESLRLLQRLAGPDERVIDPSGLAYFMPPCTDQWYLDSLFAERADRGVWMNDLGSIDTSECQWILNTYRIGMIPEPTRLRLTREYQLVNGALALPHGDARLASGDHWSQLAHHEIRSFWW